MKNTARRDLASLVASSAGDATVEDALQEAYAQGRWDDLLEPFSRIVLAASCSGIVAPVRDIESMQQDDRLTAC